MSNPLVVNPQTGFLESPSPRHINPERNYFNSERKLQFLALMDKYITERRYPDINIICHQLSITLRTLDNHIKQDKAFGHEWEERRRQMLAMFTIKLAAKAESNNGTLANLAMLRWLETGSWSPETRINHVSDSGGSKPLVNALNQVIDAEIVVDSGDNRAALPNQGDAPKQ